MWLAECKNANALWDCAKSVLLIVLWMTGCSTEALSFLSNFLTSVRSLMISSFKWKGRWHWQFSPALQLRQSQCYFISLRHSWNVQLLLGTFCLFLFFWEQCFIPYLTSSIVAWVWTYTAYFLVSLIKKQLGEVRKAWRKLLFILNTPQLKYWIHISLHTQLAKSKCQTYRCAGGICM